MIPPEYIRRATATHVAPAGRGRLHLLVLESGDVFLRRARTALEQGDVASFVSDLARAEAAVLALAECLDGDLAQRLAGLAEYIVRHLAHVDVERGLALVDDVLQSYATIVETYRELVERDSTA